MIDLYQILNEALTIPADKAGPVELKLRAALEQKYKDFKYADTIVKCCRNDEKSDKMSAKELSQTYVVGLGNLVDLFKSYDKCKTEYIKQKLDKKIHIERADGKIIELDPAKDLNKIGRLSVLKQFIDKFEKLVQNDTTISSSFKKYAITEKDRKYIRLMCWNSRAMIWGTKEFSPSQKFAVQLWQNIDTIDSGSAYGEPDEQCPYCTHSINHWEEHAGDNPNYEQYWYLAIPAGVKCVKAGDLTVPEVVKVYNQLKGLGPKILICQHDSENDWCDRDDNPISEYGIDIHDAGETIYLVDGEPVYDDEDGYDEEVDFNFSANGKDYFSDVLDLYDSNFTQVSLLSKAPRQPWESDSQHLERKNKKSDSVAFLGDGNGDLKFDFNKDTWSVPIRLDNQHFKDGKLLFSLPSVVSELIISNVKILDFSGFPKTAGEVQFVKCELTSAANWGASNISDLKLIFKNCNIARSFMLADCMPGASLQKLVIEGGIDGAETIQDFTFLGGSAKLKEIKSVDIEHTKTIMSFDGFASAVEGENISRITINWIRVGHTYVKIENFGGLPDKLDSISINGLIATKQAAEGAKEHFPAISKSFALYCDNVEQEILDPLFRAAWMHAQDGCDFYYNEPRNSVNAISVFKAFSEDKSPSRFKGLLKKNFSIIRLNLRLSPRNMYEHRAFQTCKIGFSSENAFNPDEIPLIQNIDHVFELRHGPTEMMTNSHYAVIADNRIACFDKDTLGFAKQPYASGASFKYVCLDNATRLPGIDVEHVLQCFFDTRKEDFPSTTSLVLTERFRGTKISGIAAPDFRICICPRGSEINLAEISNCKFAVIDDKRVRGRVEAKPESTELVFRNCAIGFGANICAKAVYDCTIHSRRYEDCSNDMKIYVSDGIFNTSINEPYLQSVRIYAPRLENCEIASRTTVSITGASDMSKLKAEFRQLYLYLPENVKVMKDCTFTAVTDMSSIVVKPFRGSFGKDVCNAIAEAAVSCISKSKIRMLDLSNLSEIDTLKFLERLQPGVEIQIAQMRVSSVKDFSFKLRPGSKVDAIRSYDEQLQLKGIGKNITLDGFDGSVGLSFNYFNIANDEQQVFQQFTKYFTQPVKGSDTGKAMKPDPNYVGKDGRFHAPKTLQEKFFGRPTTLEEAAWLRVMRLFD